MVRYTMMGVMLLVCTASGCGDGRPRRVPVSGQVVIDGQPLTTGAVRFYPSDGRPATGEIDANGRFSLFTYEPGDGCPPGTHRVAVFSSEEVNSTTRHWYTPKKYASANTSDLTQTIDGPTDSVLIELTWGAEKGPIVEHYYGE